MLQSQDFFLSRNIMVFYKTVAILGQKLDVSRKR